MSYQAATSSSGLRPGRNWYVIGALAILAGVAAFAATVLLAKQRLSDEIDNFTPFTVPADGIVATIDFARPGAYTLYLEHAPGAAAAQQAVPGDLAVKITGIDANDVAYNKDVTASRYSVPGKAGRSAGRFTLLTAGKYDVQVTGGQTRAPFTLAVGRGTLSSTRRLVLPGALALAVLGLVGATTLFVTASKRRQARRIAAARSAAWGSADTAVGPTDGTGWTPPPDREPTDVPATSSAARHVPLPPAFADEASGPSVVAVAPAAAPGPPAVPAPVPTPLAVRPPAVAPPTPPPPPPAPVTSPVPPPPPPPRAQSSPPAPPGTSLLPGVPAGWEAPDTANERSPWDPPTSPVS